MSRFIRMLALLGTVGAGAIINTTVAHAGGLDNVMKDIFTVKLGPNNDLAKVLGNGLKDLTRGPGATNDVVGRKGWLRQRLGI